MSGMRAHLRRLGSETGTMLIELVIGMMFLAVAVSALMAVFASTQVSLRNAGIEGTALTLAESQIEAYKTMAYNDMRMSSSTIPGSGDPYLTANSIDSTIPSPSGQFTGGTSSSTACAAATTPIPDCAVQTLNGPDGRTYRIDSYLHEVSGLKTLTVAVRQVIGGAPGSIRARATTAFDPANPPS
jgi:type II secretory pathway pseudopilin PulG